MDSRLPALDPIIKERRRIVKGTGRTQEGADNYALVKQFFRAHLCATQAECAEALGLHPMTVNRHVKRIRGEWLP